MVTPDRQRRIEIIAYLYCSQGLVQESKIAEDLGIGRNVVTEDLNTARQHGLVVEERRFIPGRMYDSRRVESLHLIHHGVRLKAHLNKKSKRLHDIFILDSGIRGVAEEGFPHRLTRLGLAAAPILRDFFRRAACVGVAWGSTLGAVVEALRPNGKLVSSTTKPVQFVPICGEPLRALRRLNSATSLAVDLDQFINGSFQNSKSLAGVPALIPKRFFQGDEVNVIKRFLATATDYGEIFGGAGKQSGPPLIEQLDAVFTSVGTASDHWKMCDVDLRQEAGSITKAELCNLAFGDLGGMLLRKPHLDPVESDKLAFLSQQWTGIRQEHYEHVAATSSTQGSPGVVVIALGANKAEALYEAIKADLLNYIICDDDLAQSVLLLSGASPIRDQFRRYTQGS